jgi:hypothetical protein
MRELYFIEICVSYGVRIVYLNTTKVIYAIGSGGAPRTVTMMCNPDGSPMIYKEDDDADS